MPTPRSKWWTARSTIDERGDAALRGRFKNLCDLLCERYWRDGCRPEDLRTQTLDMNAIRRVVQSQDRPIRCTRMLVEMAKRVSGWRGVVSCEVSPIVEGGAHIGCTLEWPNAAEYLGLDYRHPRPSGQSPAQDTAQPTSPQNQTRPDQTISDSERGEPAGEELQGVDLGSGSDGVRSTEVKLPPDSRRTVTRWLQKRGYRVSDSSVSNLFRACMDQWSSGAPPPFSVGAVFMNWVKKQEREGELQRLVKEAGGDSLKGELEDVMSGVRARV